MPRWLKRVLAFFAIGLSALALLVAGIAVAAYVLNAHDEQLSSQARAFLVAPPNDLKPEDNLFVQLAGLSAPSGGSTTAAGLALAARYERVYASSPPDYEELKHLTEPDPTALNFVGAAQFCAMRDGSVWTDAPAHEADLASLSIDNAELYGRYLDLPRQRGFYDFTAGSALTVFFTSTGLRCLFLADVTLRLRSASSAVRAQALGALTRDILVWRTMLTGDGGLVSKMLPIGYLHADYLVLADALADPAFVLPEVNDPNEVAPLFELAAWDIGDVFPVELRFFVKDLHLTVESERAKDKTRYFQLNATTNLHAARVAALMKLAAPDPEHYAALISLEGEQRREYGYSAFAHLFNPVGHALEVIAAPAWNDYLPRAWDGAALQRLVRLAYEIRHQRIAPDGIAAFIRAHPEIATHPGDGRAFEYDAAKHELRMHPLGKQTSGQQRRYAIPVWRGPAA
ncbi:MAG TPA: hypothetical protein VH109_12705 [Steroidobacteraceae bacterium]|nr:hypothetical protein [Steroidobacteraceae bacterium]